MRTRHGHLDVPPRVLALCDAALDYAEAVRRPNISEEKETKAINALVKAALLHEEAAEQAPKSNARWGGLLMENAALRCRVKDLEQLVARISEAAQKLEKGERP